MKARLLRFLLVEDDSHAASTMRSPRQNRVGNMIDRVCDGAAALEWLHDPAKVRPDVIFLDLELPSADGHEVLAAIKEDSTLRLIPVVVLATSDTELAPVTAYGHHVNSYLAKRIDFDRFQQLVPDLGLYWGIWDRSVAVNTESSVGPS